MKKELQKIIGRAIQGLNLGVELQPEEISVDYPKEEAFGDYATNAAMVLAKKVKQNPLELAEKISQNIKEDLFEKIEVAKPGFINFYLASKYFQDLVEKINSEKESFGQGAKKSKKVMVEYSQPNTHKEFHIGHLRNVFLGSAIVNTLRKNNLETISANYIGDTGTHIAKCLWGITKFHSEENLDVIKSKAEFLGKVYSEAVKAIAEKPEYENEFKEVQKAFENGDQKLIDLWEKTKQWSVDEFKEIYTELGIKFDVYFWESEEEKEGKKMLKTLLKKDFIKESRGAIIADLESYALGVLVLVRKDGSALYGLKDIPLALKKFKNYDIDESIIVVDIRQRLYFKQLFKILELLGNKKAMRHIGYEFVSLKGSETMSSRKGNIVPAKFLIEKIIEKVREKFPETNIEKEIGLGALKFYMLKYSAQNKIEFDIEEAIKLEGATGPYVQYAHARICSILRKAKDEKIDFSRKDFSLLIKPKEIELMQELNKFPELVEEIVESFEVHKLTHYAIRVADKFHSFYNACQVIDAENSELTKARLNLVNAVRIVLKEVLTLIGVAAPEKM